MQHKITTLPRQVSSDELEPGPSALPARPAQAADGVAAIASFRKRRRDPFDPEFNSDFEEICGLITERFARNGALDPEFCRFVGLLPDLKKVKDPALVREAKIIAGYLSRDDLQPPTAQQIVGGLADGLRPFGWLPALHVVC